MQAPAASPLAPTSELLERPSEGAASSPRSRACPSEPSPLEGSLDFDAARAALARSLPRLAGYARRLVPEVRSGRLGVVAEDVSQFAALVALSRLAAEQRARRAIPAWCLSDAGLERYLRGVMRRRVQRILRDRRGSTAAVESCARDDEPAPILQREERRRLGECLAGLPARDLRGFLRLGLGRRAGELAAALHLSPSALAKRRVRARAGMRARCQACPLRRERGCAWVPRNWLDSA